ncbi:hypothetical protein [Streptomyces mirabilis]|uniref:hypothetical protein n=1 Tax=Streptomyces mirabilis TaxID=68239 RepID=UPI0036648B5F
MAVRDAVYIELYAMDKLSAVDYFVCALGFTRVSDSVGVDRSSVLLRGNGARLLVTSGPARWKFLDEHGDGIGDIAVTCDDVAETLDAAVVAGARMVGTMQGNPMVTGFGGVVHTLLPHAGGLGSGLPAGRSWAACAPGGPTAQAGPDRTLEQQIEICLGRGSVAGFADLYHDAFGFHRSAGQSHRRRGRRDEGFGGHP